VDDAAAPPDTAPLDLREPGAIAVQILRCGADSVDELELTESWDIAVRCAALAGLRLSGRIADHEGQLEIDRSRTGSHWLDEAAQSMLRAGDTDEAWIRHGALRALDISRDIGGAEGWDAGPSRLGHSSASIRAIGLRDRDAARRLSAVLLSQVEPSNQETSAALLLRALGVLRPGKAGGSRYAARAGVPAIAQLLMRAEQDRCGAAAPAMAAGLRAMRDGAGAAAAGAFAVPPIGGW
jgi:hypothetical protein